MSYTVLARRYRSTTFDEVVGQVRVAQTLKKAIASGRIAHAYLFCGTRGTGKTSMARIMAKALNCQKFDAPTTTPCNTCDSCLSIARGEDMDVIEIDAASNTQVEKTREIIDNAAYRPARSRFKVYIIDEVHMLSKASFNALLKTLEEPPSHVKFILATTEPEKILPTILSRCQRYDFRNIPVREVVEHLRHICKSEKIDAEDAALQQVAKAGAGSMRDALSLLDRLISVGDKKLSADSVEALLGLPKSQAMYELAQSIGEGDVQQTLTRLDDLLRGGLSEDVLLASMIDHLRALLLIKACGGKTDLVEAPGLSDDELRKQAELFDLAALSQDIAILEELRRALRSSSAGRALVDATFVRLALSEQFTQIDQLLSRLDGTAPPPARETDQKKKHPVAPADPDRPVDRAPDRHLDRDIPKPAATVVAPAISSSDDDDDALPAVGKVWEEDTGPSLAELVRMQTASASDDEPNVEPITQTDPSNLWMGALVQLGAVAPTVHPFASKATLERVDGDVATLRFRFADVGSAEALEKPVRREQVVKVLSGLLSRPIQLKIDVEPRPEAPAEQTQPARPRRTFDRTAPIPLPAAEPIRSDRLTAEQKAEAEADPTVRAAMAEFEAIVVKVEKPTTA
jgi:DNA polymerase-3 subunit gamma/tau